MIRVVDYIFKRLVEHGIFDAFTITGGGAMHLNDAVGRCKGLRYVCNHHEQACAIALEGYARATGRMAVAVVTSGPGGTNSLTGVLGQWTDSVPAIYISGQIKIETCLVSCPDLGLRQLGDQEGKTVEMVRPITKYAVLVTKPLEIKKHLDKAIYLATHGRPGPVWLDIPLDVQGTLIDESKLIEFSPPARAEKLGNKILRQKVSRLIKLFKQAERPVFVAGHGIHIAGAREVFLEVLEKLGVPAVSTFNGVDLLPNKHRQFIGKIGTCGTRAGNFALQNADLVLSVGTRNNIRQVSYNWKAYAREAVKVTVDIDQAELKKPTVVPDLPICSDAKLFLEELGRQLKGASLPNWDNWLKWCQQRKAKYPVVLPSYRKLKNKVHPYVFIESLTESLRPKDVVIGGDGTACIVLYQAAVAKKGRRIFNNSGCASMGYDLPAAIGACVGRGNKDVVCLAGDGSLQMNIQELQTVVHNRLPIKLVYLNNQGYVSILQTQKTYFPGNPVGYDSQSGVSFPDIRKIAKAYGLPYMRISSHQGMEKKIKQVLGKKGPVICEVMLPKDYNFEPKLSSQKLPSGKMISKPLEDLYPFLPREEFKQNMIIPEWQG